MQQSDVCRKRMGERKKWSKTGAFCLTGLLVVSFTGCGGREDGILDAEGGQSDPVAMGRYVESMTEVDTGPILDLVELADGRLVLLEDGTVGRFISGDGGATWQSDALPGLDELVAKNYILDMKAACDGSVAILYERYRNLRAEEEKSEDEEEEPENGICLLLADGETQWIELPIGEEESARALCFSEDGSRLFAVSSESKIYEVDREKGTAKLFMTADIMPDMFCVWEKYMALKSETAGVVIYDLDTAERIADDVITDFVKKNCTVKEILRSSTYSIFPAEEGGIYLVCRKGVYRHVIGGTVMEQVINGNLSSLSDPMRHVVKMIRTAGEGFMTAFSEGKLSAFTYDPNITSTPSQKISAYSLTENDILRQAIIRYQGKYPDVYVEYRVGMDEEDGVTREDAVKKLNTEIMAGKGPDFLLLDGLPVESYLDKGVLADLAPCLAEMEKEEALLPNIKESYTRDEKIYMMPAAFTLPLYMTDKENMTGVSDLSSLADMFEKLRGDYPGEGIMEVYSMEMLLDALMPVSAPLWITEAGELNEEEISVYLEQTKRIYNACMEGLPEELLKKYRNRAELKIGNTDEVSVYNDLQGGAIQIATGNEKVTLGELTNAYNYAFLQSVKRVGEKENLRNYQTALTPGSVSDSFRPLALIGINAASEKADLAGGLMREIFSKEMQCMLYPTGFPVNEGGLSDYLDSLGGMLAEDRQKPGQEFSHYSFMMDDDLFLSLDLYVPTEQEREELYQMLTSVRTPYLADVVMEDAVREAGVYYLEDRCSLEEALEKIREKIAIYMAE